MPVVHFGRSPDLAAFQGEMNRLFSSFLDGPTAARRAGNGGVRRWIPAMDLVEAGEHYVVKADLPGMTEDDVKIEIENNVLTISGERRNELEETQRFYRLERTSGSFSRALTLPEGLDPEAVTATFADGVLEVRFPKPVQAAPHRVQIAVGGAEPQTIAADTAAPQDEQQAA